MLLCKFSYAGEIGDRHTQKCKPPAMLSGGFASDYKKLPGIYASLCSLYLWTFRARPSTAIQTWLSGSGLLRTAGKAFDAHNVL